MAERIVRVGVPADFADEMTARETEPDWFGKILDDAAIKEVVSVLVKAGEVKPDDQVRIEFRADPAVKSADNNRPIWVSEIMGGSLVGEEVEGNIKLYIYQAPTFENNN
ncbi:MAG: hypothetical protein HYV90_05460 [Candidatus Woesebacteria bacterium]|nr:MAG: hypothetical protein HYV90_05460 [Candidatus Woesebacteria bacterium]